MHSRRNMSLFTRALYLSVVVAALAIASPTEAGVIDFDQKAIAVSGTVFFDGGGIGVGTLTGSDIAFDRIVGHDTPFNNEGGLDCSTCLLSFTTGTLVSESTVDIDPGPGETLFTFYVFGPSAPGSVTLDGEVEPDAGGTPPHEGTIGNIVSGEFVTALLIVGPSGFSFSSINGITDTKDDELVRYYILGGEDPIDIDPIFNGSTTELGGGLEFGELGDGGCLDDDCFTSTRLELADFNNEIPESGTGLLLLLGVTSLMARRRRKG